MRLPDYQYEETRRVTYEGGACFVPVCEKCHRYVKADETIRTNEVIGLHPGANATCSQCGRTRMLFEGFVAEEA